MVCQSAKWSILRFVLSGAVSSLDSYGPMVALKEKLPCASSSDFWVRPHMVTLPARPLISAGEWLMRRNFTIGAWFLGSLTKRTPATSMYFCSALVLAPGFAAGLSTVAMGAGPLPAEPDRKSV